MKIHNVEPASASLTQNGLLSDAGLEGNKLIVEFLEWEIEPGMEEEDPYYNQPYKAGFIPQMVLLSKFPFSSSWNWLIPAWAKFCDQALEFLPSLKNKVGFEKEVKFYFIQKGKFEKTVHSNNCGQAFVILVESIKWYNTLNNNVKVGI